MTDARTSRAAKTTAYLVIIEGAGEYQSDYSVLRFQATSPQDAIDQAIAPEMGYGKSEDGTAFVVEERHVTAFAVNDSTRSVATPMTEQVPL